MWPHHREEGSDTDGTARIPPYLRAAQPAPRSDDGAVPAAAQPPDIIPGEEDTASSASLRPFILTAGRVDTGESDIGLETQVVARPDAHTWPGLGPELRSILALCREPISVAEISAQLHLHLGVTRILVGDLRAAGHVSVHVVDPKAAHDPETILRVIRGLRAIS